MSVLGLQERFLTFTLVESKFALCLKVALFRSYPTVKVSREV